MDARLRELALLLPDLREKLPVMQVKALALMAADTQALAEKLLALRKIFPSANISRVSPALIVIAVLTASLLVRDQFSLRQVLCDRWSSDSRKLF
jgi:hypothetical protein